MEKHGAKCIGVLKQQTIWNMKKEAKTTNIQERREYHTFFSASSLFQSHFINTVVLP